MEEVIKMLLSLHGELKIIRDQLQQLNKSRLETFQDTWIDGQEVMQLMHISPRTLQNLRDEGILPFSRIKNKLYYKLSAIENMLSNGYSGSKSQNHGTN